MIFLYFCLLSFQSDQYICYAQPLEEIGESFVGMYIEMLKYIYMQSFVTKNTEISEILIELAFFRTPWFLLYLTIAWLWLFTTLAIFRARHRMKTNKTTTIHRKQNDDPCWSLLQKKGNNPCARERSSCFLFRHPQCNS